MQIPLYLPVIASEANYLPCWDFALLEGFALGPLAGQFVGCAAGGGGQVALQLRMGFRSRLGYPHSGV